MDSFNFIRDIAKRVVIICSTLSLVLFSVLYIIDFRDFEARCHLKGEISGFNGENPSYILVTVVNHQTEEEEEERINLDDIVIIRASAFKNKRLLETNNPYKEENNFYFIRETFKEIEEDIAVHKHPYIWRPNLRESIIINQLYVRKLSKKGNVRECEMEGGTVVKIARRQWSEAKRRFYEFCNVG